MTPAAVIRYLERMAQINLTEKTYLLESAELLRAGQLPGWYQAQIPAHREAWAGGTALA